MTLTVYFLFSIFFWRIIVKFSTNTLRRVSEFRNIALSEFTSWLRLLVAFLLNEVDHNLLFGWDLAQINIWERNFLKQQCILSKKKVLWSSNQFWLGSDAWYMHPLLFDPPPHPAVLIPASPSLPLRPHLLPLACGRIDGKGAHRKKFKWRSSCRMVMRRCY